MNLNILLLEGYGSASGGFRGGAIAPTHPSRRPPPSRRPNPSPKGKLGSLYQATVKGTMSPEIVVIICHKLAYSS